jgi:deoxyribonuclease V
VVLACVDVDYRADEAWAACVLFREWTSANSRGMYLAHVDEVAPYQPGQFYLRELPCILAVLGQVPEKVETVVVDGYVWLGSDRRPGLGAHLYEALGRTTPVVGVAKSAFPETPAIPILRGRSRRPLWVTSVGVECHDAASDIQQMHGPYRVPTLLRQVDACAQQAWSTASR